MRNELHARNPKTVIYGTETIFFLFPKSCALIPQNICHKNIIDSSSLPCFKKSIRKWKPNCPCRLCKIFLRHVGFIQLNNSPPFSVFSLVYLKFIYLFIFILHIISKNYSFSFLVFLGSCQGPIRVLVFQFSQGPARVPLGPQVLVFWYATAFDSSYQRMTSDYVKHVFFFREHVYLRLLNLHYWIF